MPRAVPEGVARRQQSQLRTNSGRVRWGRPIVSDLVAPATDDRLARKENKSYPMGTVRRAVGNDTMPIGPEMAEA
jgi:hypothetical protein